MPRPCVPHAPSNAQNAADVELQNSRCFEELLHSLDRPPEVSKTGPSVDTGGLTLSELKRALHNFEDRIMGRLDDWADRKLLHLASRRVVGTDHGIVSGPVSPDASSSLTALALSTSDVMAVDPHCRSSLGNRASRRVSARASYSADDVLRRDSAKHHARDWNSQQRSVSLVAQTRLKKFVGSIHFEATLACIIVLNAVFLGWEVEYRAQYKNEERPVSFVVIDFTFTGVFFFELILRSCALRGQLFSADHRLWSCLDIILVLSSIMNACVEGLVLLQVSNSSGLNLNNLRIVRVLRITRMVRTLRMARLFRYVSSLRTLVASILATLNSLLWAFCLIAAVIYSVAIVFTESTTYYLGGTEVDSAAGDFWGSLSISMFTLFQSVSGGLSWRDAAEPLYDISLGLVILFSLYIFFTTFAVMNVLTGVFCQSAIEAVGRDPDYEVQAVLARRKAYTDNIHRLFDRVDADSSNSITLTELETIFGDDYMKAYLMVMGIDVEDAWSLFKLMDKDEDHAIDRHEFVKGLLQLQGDAKRVDIQAMMENQKFMSKQIADMAGRTGTRHNLASGSSSLACSAHLTPIHSGHSFVGGGLVTRELYQDDAMR